MAHQIKFECNKTYASEANAVKAVEKANISDEFRYFIYQNPEGRFIPVFLGERCIQAGIHFRFNVAG